MNVTISLHAIISLMTIVVISLMLTMAVRLLLQRRKRAFVHMILALTMMLCEHIMTVVTELEKGSTIWLDGIKDGLHAASLIIICMAFYHLYYMPRRYTIILQYVLVVLSASLVLTKYIPNGLISLGQEEWIKTYGVSIGMFAVISGIAYWMGPKMRQQTLFYTAIVLIGIEEVIRFPGLMLPDRAMQVLHASSLIYMFLFCIMLFSRVVEILHAISVSSVTDSLTGLYLRKFFNTEVQKCIRSNISCSVIFSDIDNFKKLNDTKGHHMGDAMLKLVALIMQEESKGVGVAGRYGGEEIVLLVSDPSVHVGQLAEKIRARIERESIVTASIGHSSFSQGKTVEELVKEADEAMYIAKKSGKNRVLSYKEALVVVLPKEEVAVGR